MSNESSYCDSEKPKKRKSRHTFAFLISCCLFLAVACACLLAALVLIGKHIVYNYPPAGRSRSGLEPVPKTSLWWRLPNDTKPVSYDIVLRPDLETGNFRGTVDIVVNVTRNRKDIVLHSKNLTIDTVELRRRDSKVIDVDKVEENADDQVLIIRTRQVITPGLYGVRFEYRGSMLDKMVGLYRSARKDDQGITRYMATSKFEPTYARQAFPCFDEPNLKATYTVHLLKPKDPTYIALSNYPQHSEEETTDGIMVHFNETVPMSTYLSCFIVSDFTYSNTSFNNGANGQVPFRVYATPEQLDKTTYAGKVGKAVIEFYVDYFNIPYPLPKLDMVAVPDFVSGAMEHWGLVTYRETALLYNPTTHAASNKQRVATVVAHELAHSWFGNLVTMDWWNNLWLNEGFASYIEYKGVNAAESEWHMMDQFIVTDLHNVLSLDATQGSHPIIQTVTTPDQITEVFDTISYDKGASILRMLEHVVGSDNFQNGVTNYLKKKAYSSAVSQNLWDEIQTVVGNTVNVTQFMSTFTIQMGYPILDVKVDGNTYTFTQKRFLIDYDSVRKQKSSPLNYKWDVPINYITDLGESQIHWFYHNDDEFSIDIPSGARWVKFNPSQVNYYRVNYDEAGWRNLIANIETFTTADRTHLLEESFSIAQSGELSYEIPLELSKYLVNETDYYVPWSVASSKLQSISKYLQNSQYDSEFKAYVISLLTPAYENLTWNDPVDESEAHLTKLARVLILNLACAMDYEDALYEARTIFDQWIEDTTFYISPNLRSIVYKFGMVTADESTWNKMFDVFAQETDATEKLKLMNGLANVRNPSLLTKLIELAKDETYVRSQDYFTLLQYISANPVGQSIVWDYVRENWDYLVQRFGLNDRYLGRLIPSITNRFSTNIKVEEMQHFFAKNPEAGAGQSARTQALETVNNNIKWLGKHKEVVEQWINNNRNVVTN